MADAAKVNLAFREESLAFTEKNIFWLVPILMKEKKSYFSRWHITVEPDQGKHEDAASFASCIVTHF